MQQNWSASCISLKHQQNGWTEPAMLLPR